MTPKESQCDRSYSPPTDEQLERFVRALIAGEANRRGIAIDPVFGARMVMRTPWMKEEWLRRHRELQEAVSHG